MGRTDESLTRRVDELLDLGQALSDHWDRGKYYGWKSGVQSLIVRVFEKDHPHFSNFGSIEDSHGGYDLEAGLGVLRAVRSDVVAKFYSTTPNPASGKFTSGPTGGTSTPLSPGISS